MRRMANAVAVRLPRLAGRRSGSSHTPFLKSPITRLPGLRLASGSTTNLGRVPSGGDTGVLRLGVYLACVFFLAEPDVQLEFRAEIFQGFTEVLPCRITRFCDLA